MQRALFFWSDSPLKRANTRLYSLLGLLALLVALPASGCRAGSAEARERTERPTAVRVVAIEQRPVRETIDYVGTLRARRTFRVTARVPGTLATLDVEEGDRVERDQVLARIDAPELEAKLARAEAEVRRAKTERDYLCDTFETDRRLHDSGALPKSKLDASRKRCSSGKEAVAAARAKRHEVRTRLDKRTERAPVAGIVLERRAEPGEHVGPGRPLVVLADAAREVVVPVVESDLDRGIGPETPVRLRLDGESVEATVDRTAVTAKGPGRAVDVHIPLPDETSARQVGRSIDVRFVVAEDATATPVPREALVRDEDGWSIFVVDGEVAHRRTVERGVTEGNWVAVRPTLTPGSRVVVTNLDTVRDGTAVYPVDTAGGAQ